MCTMVASLNNVILWGKKQNKTKNPPGIPMCPPNYTQNRKVRDSPDAPDPKDDTPTIQIQSLRRLKARVQLINAEKTKWSHRTGKDLDSRTFPSERSERNRPLEED